MFANITRTTLCLTAFSIATLMGAPLDATKTESLDWNWKFARFGKMPDGSTLPEPGKAWDSPRQRVKKPATRPTMP